MVGGEAVQQAGGVGQVVVLQLAVRPALVSQDLQSPGPAPHYLLLAAVDEGSGGGGGS